jgi:hypothetical protein
MALEVVGEGWIDIDAMVEANEKTLMHAKRDVSSLDGERQRPATDCLGDYGVRSIVYQRRLEIAEA